MKLIKKTKYPSDKMKGVDDLSYKKQGFIGFLIGFGFLLAAKYFGGIFLIFAVPFMIGSIFVWLSKPDIKPSEPEPPVDTLKPDAPTATNTVKPDDQLQWLSEFNSILESIPKEPINPCDDPAPRLHTKEIMANITYSNVTKRSNFEKLGNFCVIDTETTGFNVHSDRIIEISVVRFRSWEPVSTFTTLLNPKKAIPAAASRVNHITDDMVKDAPEFGRIVPQIAAFIADDNIVGHNLAFDLKFVLKGGYDFSKSGRKYYDTLALARNIVKDETDNHKLDTLCGYFLIRPDSSGHRALSDAYSTGILFKKLVRMRISNIQ